MLFTATGRSSWLQRLQNKPLLNTFLPHRSQNETYQIEMSYLWEKKKQKTDESTLFVQQHDIIQKLSSSVLEEMVVVVLLPGGSDKMQS